MNEQVIAVIVNGRAYEAAVEPRLLLSDFLRPALGDDSLRWGLMGIIPFALAAAATQFAMTRHLNRELAE